MRVQDIMTTPVIAILPSASIADAARLMLTNRISGLPVVTSNGTLVGIVTEGDFLHRKELGTDLKRSWWLEFLLSPGKIAGEYVQANARKVDEVMCADVATTSRDTPLADVVEVMVRRHIKRLPVVEDGKVVGIVARCDLMRALLGALPTPKSPEPDDERIRQEIAAELKGKIWAGKGSIEAKVDKGAVELTGTILDERERQAARVAAENIAGVKSVTDHLVWIEPMSGLVVDPPL